MCFSFADSQSGSASAEIKDELNVANASQIKHPTGKRRKRLNNLDSGKLELI